MDPVGLESSEDAEVGEAATTGGTTGVTLIDGFGVGALLGGNGG